MLKDNKLYDKELMAEEQKQDLCIREIKAKDWGLINSNAHRKGFSKKEKVTDFIGWLTEIAVCRYIAKQMS